MFVLAKLTPDEGDLSVKHLGGGQETTAVNIFRKSKSRLKTRDFAKSDGCRINSLGKHFPGKAMKKLDN